MPGRDPRAAVPAGSSHRRDRWSEHFAVAAFGRDAQRSGVFRIDDADSPCTPECLVAPGESPSDDFAGEPLAMCARDQRPTGFRNAFDRRHHVALQIVEAGLADEAAGCLVLDRPEAVAQQRPQAGMTQEAHPAFLACARLAADEAGDVRIGPHGDIGIEIIELVRPQDGSLRLDDRCAGCSWISHNSASRRMIAENRLRNDHAQIQSGCLPVPHACRPNVQQEPGQRRSSSSAKNEVEALRARKL